MSDSERTSRRAYRGSVTKLVRKVEEELYKRPEDRDLHRLKHYQDTLLLKKEVLKELDQLIWKQVSDEDAEEELEQVDFYMEQISLCLLNLEEALQQPKVSDSSHIEPARKSASHTLTTTSLADHTSDPGDSTTSARPRPREPTLSLPEGIRISDTTVVRHPTPATRMKLPKITMKKFDGNITQWLPFWSHFEAAVHSNEDLSDVEKFTYLNSLLASKAAEAIEGMAITPANYREAVARLKKRYGNTRLIVKQHMEAILQLPAVRDHHNLPAMRKLVDTIEKNIAGLRALGQSEEAYGGVVAPLIMKRLPQEIRLAVTRELGPAPEDVTRITQVVDEEITNRESCADPEDLEEPLPNPSRRHQPTAAAFLANSHNNCPFCGKEHKPEACTKVTTPSARSTILRKQGRCFNCLKRNHLSRECRAKERCQKCRGKHHTAVCRGENSKPQTPPTRSQGGGSRPRPSEAPPTGDDATPTNSLYAGSPSAVLLQTAKMTVFKPNSSSSGAREVRAVLDTGSQRTYLTQEIAKELQLTASRSEHLRIQTFGKTEGEDSNCQVVEIAIKTHKNGPLKIEALVVPLICDPLSSQPTRRAREQHPHLRGLYLADYSREDDKLPIDILIGSDWYWSLVTGNTRRGKTGPIAIHTKVGWVLSGPTEVPNTTKAANLLVRTTHLLKIHTTPVEDNMDQTLKKFWDLESLGIQPQETSVQEEFTQSIHFKEGRYEVTLPWKPTHRPLPTNLELCKRRLTSLLKRLKTTPKILEDYNNIIQEQLHKGIVEPVPEEEADSQGRIHYLPHHGVVRTDKTTTKLRIVYDGSAKTGSNPALNDCLYTGPNVEQSIFDILLRFRLHPIAMVADIEKAFLMVGVNPPDRNALRFLWFHNIQEDQPQPLHLRFTRVTFGVNCSPFLLKATIQHHIQAYQEEDPQFVKTFLQSIYVDDLTIGAANTQEAYQLYTKSKTRLAEAGFNLRKFHTNSHPLQIQIDSNEDSNCHQQTTTAEEDLSFTQSTLGVKGEKSGEEEEKLQHKVLGVRWKPREDSLTFNLREMAEHCKGERPTKREVVGAAATVYDPLGVLTPVTVRWKMLFQTICREGLDWDQELIGESLKEWEKLTTALREEDITLTIPRCYGAERGKSVRLAGFCDASERAYGAVVYLRLEGDGGARVRFLASKTRVAPTKAMTIPRLELMSALLLSRLCKSVEEALKEVVELEETSCFTDSRVALHWIRGVDQQWKQFVENRVVSIRGLMPEQRWKHCPGKLNPADIPSRGMLPGELEKNQMWLNGPEWLRHSLDPPVSEKSQGMPEECLREQRNKKSHNLVTLQRRKKGIGQLININHYSNLSRLLGTTARVLQFIHLIRGRGKELVELHQEAKLLWNKEAQVELEEDPQFQTWQKQLNLQRDEKSLWRCVGRMANAPFTEEVKKPLLIGRSHPLARLLVSEAHRRVLHNGTRDTLTELRATHWMIKARSLVRQVIKECPICRRHEGRPFKPLDPPALPPFRVQPSRPFDSTGIDLAGPLYIKGHGEPKAWVCLFTCCSTRAVHLEVVPDLTTETFIRAFKRFSSRRGIPGRIISDNAQTFKAADQKIQALTKDPEVQDQLERKNIHWKFIVEKAPWQGGMYERMIKSAKRCLKKAIGRASLTLEELMTLVAEVEAVLNSRPLSYLSSDDQEEPLTPSHLVTGNRILSLPDPSIRDGEDPSYEPTHESLSRRMKALCEIKAKFWNRWKSEYLQELREHHRTWKSSSGVCRPIEVGEAVIIYDEGQPRGLWRLGRVVAVIHSEDGGVRAASVKVLSSTGRPTILRRPIQHLYPLEVRKTVGDGATRGTVTQGEASGDETPDCHIGRLAHGVPTQPGEEQEKTPEVPSQKETGRQAASRARERLQGLAAQNLI